MYVYKIMNDYVIKIFEMWNGLGNTNRLNNKYKNNKEQGVKPGGGTRQEWVEGGDTSQYFTMDYSHVKRRRPIHNKSLPAAAPWIHAPPWKLPRTNLFWFPNFVIVF